MAIQLYFFKEIKAFLVSVLACNPLYGLDGDVPLDRVWFCPLVLNRAYNFALVCPKHGI